MLSLLSLLLLLLTAGVYSWTRTLQSTTTTTTTPAAVAASRRPFLSAVATHLYSLSTALSMAAAGDEASGEAEGADLAAEFFKLAIGLDSSDFFRPR
jgi:hypothetical protein